MPARRRSPLASQFPPELQVAATKGNTLTDSRGRKYIDFVMGWCVGNFGWGADAAVEALERFKGPDYVYPGYSYAPWTELARLLVSLAPRPLTTCFRATGGSEAVDLAMQAAMIHTGRRAFLSLEDSYHGNSLAGLSRRYGTMFIADEVACGFGRTGRVFACEHFDLDPDMLCVAKAMSGGLSPIGAVIATAPIAESMEENDGNFYSTYGWHPRSVAAAIATLRALKTNGASLLAGIAEMSEYFRVRLLQLEFEQPAAVRIQGLAIGIDVGDEEYADAIVEKCHRNGLLVSSEGSSVLLLPALTIDQRTAAKGLDILSRSI